MGVFRRLQKHVFLRFSTAFPAFPLGFSKDIIHPTCTGLASSLQTINVLAGGLLGMLSFQALAQIGDGFFSFWETSRLFCCWIQKNRSGCFFCSFFFVIFLKNHTCCKWMLHLAGLHHTYIYAVQAGLTYLFLPVTHFSSQEVWSIVCHGFPKHGKSESITFASSAWD